MRFFSLVFLVVVSPSLLAEVVHSIPIYKYEASTYYVDVSVADGESESYLIDTGASFVTISEATLSRLLDKQQAEFVKVMSASLLDGTALNGSV